MTERWAICNSSPPERPNVSHGANLGSDHTKYDERGAWIIDDYAAVHAAAGDPLVRQEWHDAHRLRRQTKDLMQRLTARDVFTPA